ncbi:MAG: tail fiber domain-containing protein [Candidatus Paceibacterota bacterium]|jgi:hypothetical protein
MRGTTAKIQASGGKDIEIIPNANKNILLEVTGTGNVGIGTTTPAYKLDVNGAINATSLLVNGVAVGTSSDSYWSTATGGINYAGGNVGIGTATPANALHVVNSNLGGARITVENSGSTGYTGGTFLATSDSGVRGAGLYTWQNNSKSWYIGTPYYSGVAADNNFIIGYSDSTSFNGAAAVLTNSMFVLKNTGNVGIGTTSPVNKLDVVGVGTGQTTLFSIRNSSGTANNTADIDFSVSAAASTLGRIGIIRTNAAISGDTDIVFSNARGSIGLLESMRITSTGNLGLGTTSPLAKLHVYKGAAGGTITPSTSAGIVIENSDDVSLQLFTPIDKQGIIQFGSSINGAQGRIAYQSSSNATTDYMSFDIVGTEKMRIDVDGNLGLGTTTPAQALDLGSVSASITLSDTTAYHQIITGGTTDLALMPGGKVGIGTTTPTTKLDVAGTVNATGLTINGVPVATSSDTYWNAVAGGISYTAGNVGIGTATPVSKLHLGIAATATANYGTLSIGSGAFDGATLGYFVGSASGTQIAINAGTGFAGNLIDLQTAGVSKLVVTGAGNVGIGVAAPASPLDVNGDIRIHASSGGRLVFADGTTMSTANVGSADSLSNAGDAVIWGDSDASDVGDIIFKTDGSEKMRLSNAGLITLSNGSLFGSSIGWGTGLGAITHLLGPTDAVFKITSYLTNAFTIDSGSTGAINIGTSAFAKTITIGNATGATSLVLNSGTGAINIGTSIAKTITIGNVTGATSVVLNSGTGAINIGISTAKTITIGNVTGATAVKINTGTGDFAVNTSQLFVDEVSGNVGIGTVTPTAKLEVNGSVLFSGSTNVVPVDGELVYDTSVHAYKYYDSALVDWRSLAGGDISSTGSFWTQNGTILSYTAGNVGIGTTDPTAVLHLKAGTIDANTAPLKFTSGPLNTTAEAGAVEFLTDKFYGTITTSAARKTFAFLESPAFTTPALGAATGTGLALTSTNTTQVTTASALVLNANSLTTGTGLYSASSTLTTGMLVNLQVSGTAAAASQTVLNILTAGANATTAITTYGAQISNTHTNATSGTNIALYLNASGATTANYGLIVNAGSVGIGTTAPTQALDVRGNIYTPAGNAVIVGNTYVSSDVIIGTSATSGLIVRASDAAGFLNFQTGGSNDRMTILANGNVGIGMTNPSVALDVTGDIEYTGTITDVSDERLKENVTTIAGNSALLIINQLQAKSFNMLGTNRKEYGYIAQEVQNIFPDSVSIIDPTTGYLGINYISFIPLLSESIKEMNLKINEINNFEKENDWRDSLIAWFGNMENKIEKLFAKEIHTEKICVKKSDGTEFCANGDQLEQMANSLSGSAIENLSGGGSATTESQSEPQLEPEANQPSIEEEKSTASSVEEGEIVEPSAETPIAETPVVEEPVIETPAIEEPTTIEAPVIETPTVETPI